MEPSSSDLEFFDFKNSSDEEIKEIQAILKSPGSNGCVELPWEIFVKSNCKGSLLENEDAALETDPESTKFSKNVVETTEQTLSFVPPQTLLPPVAPLPPPTVEAFVSLPTTVGLYQNAPYFVSRSIPYLRGYPPMGVPFFACPMPGTGEANPYGQFVPMVPERPIEEPNPKSRDRQSNRRSSKKRHSEGSENVTVYPEALATCPTSVPLVPLPVPPSTFVGGNMQMHGYPPGLPSPAMYYVPVFNHPYGGYLPPSGPPMMLPVSVAPELSCSPHGGEEVLLTDNGGREAFQAEGRESPITASSGGPYESPPTSSNGSLNESPHTFAKSGSPCESPQTVSNGGLKESLQADHGEIADDNSCIDESLPTDNCSSGKVLHTLNSPIKETIPNVQSDCNKVSISPNTVNVQPIHPNAKLDVTESEERISLSDSLSGPLVEGSCSMNCFEKTEKCLEEIIPLLEMVETVPTEAEETAPSKVPFAEIAKPVPTRDKDCPPATEKVKQVIRDPSRCWADLFKGPSLAVNGFETPPRQRHDKKSTLNNGKRDVTNGKVYSVPPSNSLH